MDFVNFLACTSSDVACGSFCIPSRIVTLVHSAIVLIQIVVPVLLIIFGMLDLGKAVIASKEDEIKKGQKTFISRLIAAIIVFFVITVVRLVLNLAVDTSDSADNTNIINCFNTFVNGEPTGNKGGK